MSVQNDTKNGDYNINSLSSEFSEELNISNDDSEKLKLSDVQQEHVEKLSTILQRDYRAFDFSMMGCGKTYTTTALALKYNYPVLVICPATMEAKWKTVLSKYGATIVAVIGYQSLRSISGCQPSHGLLTRDDSKIPFSAKTKNEETLEFISDPTESRFKVTDLYNSYISSQSGILLVLDEFHNLKNKSDQAEACKALITAILDKGGKSRILLESGSPIDKEEHAINVMELTGFIRNNILFTYNKTTNQYTLYGAAEIKNICFGINPRVTDDIFAENPITSRNIRHICYLLFQKVLKKYVSTSMPPLISNKNIDCKNGYYNMSEEDSKILENAITDLRKASQFSEEKGTASHSGENVTNALVNTELSKVPIWVRKTKKDMIQDQKCKVGIFVNYKEPLEKLIEELKEYNPLVLQGSVSKDKRKKIIADFQEPSTERRLLISNIKVACTGIDLDDKHGGFIRKAYISPNYLISDLHQLTRRFLREDSKSMPIIRFVYGKCGRMETSILNALARKTHVLKDTLEDQVEYGILFPGEYEEEIEEDPSNLNPFKTTIQETQKPTFQKSYSGGSTTWQKSTAPQKIEFKPVINTSLSGFSFTFSGLTHV